MSSSEQGMHEGMGVGHTKHCSSRGFTPGELVLRFVFGVGGLFVAHTGDAFGMVVRESLTLTEYGLRVLVGHVIKLSLLIGSKLSHARLSRIERKKVEKQKKESAFGRFGGRHETPKARDYISIIIGSLRNLYMPGLRARQITNLLEARRLSICYPSDVYGDLKNSVNDSCWCYSSVTSKSPNFKINVGHLRRRHDFVDRRHPIDDAL